MTALGHDWPLTDTENWRAQAACKTRPDLNWFPGRGESVTEQRAVCATCPVRDDCLADAMSVPGKHDFGIWGGTSEIQRLRVRRRKYQMTDRQPAKCGTRSGYRKHQRNDTEPCDECRAANSAYEAERKTR